MFESKLVEHLFNSIPSAIRNSVSKYIYIVGFDRLTKKGIMGDISKMK
jgi:hypothetical protein